MRLTQKMKQTLEALDRAPNLESHVQMSTAWALKNRHLAEYVSGRGPRTGAGDFPHYRMRLTASGRAWCDHHYKKLAPHDL